MLRNVIKYSHSAVNVFVVSIAFAVDIIGNVDAFVFFVGLKIGAVVVLASAVAAIRNKVIFVKYI